MKLKKCQKGINQTKQLKFITDMCKEYGGNTEKEVSERVDLPGGNKVKKVFIKQNR